MTEAWEKLSKKLQKMGEGEHTLFCTYERGSHHDLRSHNLCGRPQSEHDAVESSKKDAPQILDHGSCCCTGDAVVGVVVVLAVLFYADDGMMVVMMTTKMMKNFNKRYNQPIKTFYL